MWRQRQRINLRPLSLRLHLWSPSLNCWFWCGELHLLIERDGPGDLMLVQCWACSCLSPQLLVIVKYHQEPVAEQWRPWQRLWCYTRDAGCLIGDMQLQFLNSKWCLEKKTFNSWGIMHSTKYSIQTALESRLVSKLSLNHKILWSVQGSLSCVIFAVYQLIRRYESFNSWICAFKSSQGVKWLPTSKTGTIEKFACIKICPHLADSTFQETSAIFWTKKWRNNASIQFRNYFSRQTGPLCI